jgi:hypothetical protein
LSATTCCAAYSATSEVEPALPGYPRAAAFTIHR